MGANCSAEQAKLILDHVAPTGRVWLFTDGDEAGEWCAASAMEKLAPQRKVERAKLDKGQQPTDCCLGQLAEFFGRPPL